MSALRVLAAPDKFRGTASATEVARAAADAVLELGCEATVLPLADGGEGTLEALGGPNRWTQVTGPLGRPVTAPWRLTDDGRAVIEMAQASGLLLAGGAAANDAWTATTRGTGELIVAATEAGAHRVLVGLGGSATSDGGLGAFEAVRAHPAWSTPGGDRPELVVCCDVRTVFTDAATVFGPQKGAGPAMVERLSARLRDLAGTYRDDHGVDVTSLPGSGAAGGLAGALAVLGGRLQPGFDAVAATVGLDAVLARADLVITGEGLLDAGSFHGKVVGEVLTRSAARGIPVLAVVGGIARDALVDRPAGDLTVLGLVDRFGRQEAFAHTLPCVRQAVRELVADRLSRELGPTPTERAASARPR